MNRQKSGMTGRARHRFLENRHPCQDGHRTSGGLKLSQMGARQTIAPAANFCYQSAGEPVANVLRIKGWK
jgi:hypothetical protein